MVRRNAKMPKRKQPKKQAKPKPQKAATPFADTGKIVGRSLGTVFGRPDLGSDLGGWLGSGIGKIFGSGSYKLKQNSLWTGSQTPAMHSNAETVRFTHREYITDISSSTGFVATQYQINPGLQGTFPFLSALASNFQTYEFKGLVFHFKSTSADALNSTNTALGSVMMAAQYNSLDPVFTNKQQLLNEMWSVDTKPSEQCLLPIECDPQENPLKVQYVRTGALPTNADAKMYDLCKVTVATYGSQAAAVVGELWVSYDVVLRKPRAFSAYGGDVTSLTVQRSICTSANPFGSVILNSANNSLGATFTFSTLTIPSLVSGYFFVQLFWKGDSGTWTLPVTTLTGASFITQQSQATNDCFGTAVTSMSTSFVMYIPDTNQAAVISLGNAGAFSTNNQCRIIIAELSSSTIAT